jgi:hypothetical protein
MHPKQAIDRRQGEDEGSHKQGNAIPGEFHEARTVGRLTAENSAKGYQTPSFDQS